MKLIHVALAVRTESNAERFYGDLLGLEKVGAKTASADLARRIFDLETELQIVNYADDTLCFEIFIGAWPCEPLPRIEHVCLQVGSLDPFLRKCREFNLSIRQIPKEDGSFLTFVRDFDGNLFEIKAA